jgi:hypothetical protein
MKAYFLKNLILLVFLLKYYTGDFQEVIKELKKLEMSLLLVLKKMKIKQRNESFAK